MDGELPVAGGRMKDEREMMRIARSPIRPGSEYGRTGTGVRLTKSDCAARDWNRREKHRSQPVPSCGVQGHGGATGHSDSG